METIESAGSASTTTETPKICDIPPTRQRKACTNLAEWKFIVFGGLDMVLYRCWRHAGNLERELISKRSQYYRRRIAR
jgi:hypothetical protein